MFKFVAFKTPKPRGFNYKPVYYNPEKEAREERRRELLAQRGVFEDSTDDNGKGGDEYHPGQFIASRRERRISNAQDQSRGSNRVKIFSLLVVVLLLGYWIFAM